jgi:hypothetical protein
MTVILSLSKCHSGQACIIVLSNRGGGVDYVVFALISKAWQQSIPIPGENRL